MVTIKDVARAAGVSVSTVSLVLNSTLENTRTAPETWKKVQNVIEELNYKPSATARKLRKTERARTVVGLLWSIEYNYTFLGECLVLLQRAFDAMNFPCNIVVYTFQTGTLESVMLQAKEEMMDGLIIALPEVVDLQWLERHPTTIPIVLLGRKLDIFSYVRADNDLAGQLAAQPLKSWRGKDVAVVHYEAPIQGVQKQLDGFQSVCREAGVRLRYYTLQRSPDDHSILQGNQQILQDGIPDAVVYFAGDRTAYTSLYDFADLGIRIPEELKIIQINVFSGRLPAPVRPRLTTVTCDTRAMIRHCADILHRLIEQPDMPLEHHVYTPTLIYQDTFPQEA